VNAARREGGGDNDSGSNGTVQMRKKKGGRVNALEDVYQHRGRSGEEQSDAGKIQ